MHSDESVCRKIFVWLGAEQEQEDTNAFRRSFAARIAQILPADPWLREQVIQLLDSRSWTARQGAAWALLDMPECPPASVLPKLRGLLDDLRSDRNWEEQLQVAELFINAQDRSLSAQTVALLLDAMDFATLP